MQNENEWYKINKKTLNGVYKKDYLKKLKANALSFFLIINYILLIINLSLLGKVKHIIITIEI